MPFLKGLEVLPAGETMSAMEACEEAIASVKTAVAEARNFIAAKNLEIKQFAEAASKPAATEFGQLTERINCSSSRFGIRRPTGAERAGCVGDGPWQGGGEGRCTLHATTCLLRVPLSGGQRTWRRSARSARVAPGAVPGGPEADDICPSSSGWRADVVDTATRCGRGLYPGQAAEQQRR